MQTSTKKIQKEKNGVETRGKKRKYTDEMLEDLIEEYLDENPHVTILVPSKIATFARNKGLKIFENIRYSQFTDNAYIKEKIDKFNEIHRKVVVPSKTSPDKRTRLNTDKIVDAYYSDAKILKATLRKFNAAYENMRKERIEYLSNIESLKKEVADLKKQVEQFESEKAELKRAKAQQAKINRENARKIAHANKVERFMRSLDMYEDLIKRKIADELDAENLKLLLSNAGLLYEDEKANADLMYSDILQKENETEINHYDFVEIDNNDNYFDDMDDDDFLSVFENFDDEY